MSKRYPRAKWILPDVVDPTTHKCYTISVPNDRFHIAAFLGALQDLGSAMQWADDEAHTAKDVALVWRDVIDNLCAEETDEDCCMQCSPVNKPFLDPLELGETKKLQVVVEAGEFQLLPIILHARQSLTISDMRGQWRDSTYHPEIECTSNWETPTGLIISAGGAAPADTFITDVLPEVPHMKLIMRVNVCGTLSYHDLDDPITYTVPESVGEEGVFIEFLGNCPLDINNEIASGFLGYGMVCFKAIVSDANYCPQVFIDFEEDPPTTYELINGTIVETSPIGEGAACRGDSISSVSKEVEIAIATEDCTARDYAFTYYVQNGSSPIGMSTTWFLRRENGTVIDFGNESWVPGNNTVETRTVSLGSAPGVFSIELQVIVTTSAPIDPDFQLFVDNLFMN